MTSEEGLPDSDAEAQPRVGRTLLKICLLLMPPTFLLLASLLYLVLRVLGWWDSVRDALDGWQF